MNLSNLIKSLLGTKPKFSPVMYCFICSTRNRWVPGEEGKRFQCERGHTFTVPTGRPVNIDDEIKP